jgi:type I restriction enzyme, S subunit
MEIDSHEAPSRARQLVAKDDVLVSTVRPNLNAVAYLEEEFDGATASTGFCVLRAKSNKLDSRYLYYWVHITYFIDDMVRESTGASYPAVSDSIIKKNEIPLPPIEEQKRIAAILDKADRVRRKRQEAIRLTEELGRSIFLDMFGDPVTNPKGWEIVEIDQIVDAIESGWSPKCDSRIAEPNEWGVLKLGAITWGTFNEQENKALLPDTRPKPLLEVLSGDLLFARKNTYELVGASVYVHQTRLKLLLPDLIFRLKVNNMVNPVYLWQALSQSSMRKEISLSNVKLIAVPLRMR